MAPEMAFVLRFSGFFTLDREALESYELGSGEVHEDGTGGGEVGSGASSSSAEVGRAKDDLVKIQEMLLLFSERLAQLEGGTVAGGQLDDEGEGGGGAHLHTSRKGKGKASKGGSSGGGGGAKRRRKDEG